jgi:hypothetical protein
MIRPTLLILFFMTFCYAANEGFYVSTAGLPEVFSAGIPTVYTGSSPVIDSIVPRYSWADSAFNVYASNFTDSAKSFCKANSVNLSCIDFGNPKRYKLPLWTPPGLYWLKIGTIEDTDSTVTDSLRVRVLKFEVLDGSER